MNTSGKIKDWLLILLAVIIVVISVFVYYRNVRKSINVGQNRSGKLTLVLDYGSENRQVFQTSKAENRAWNLLQQATVLTKIDLETDNNFMPVKIDGMKNEDDGRQWIFYVNGARQDSSPLDVVVRAPDEVVFRFE